MKRFLSTLIIIATLMAFSPFVIPASSASFAEDEFGNSSSTDVRDILKFSCTYDPEKESISISGTMEHDAVAQHVNSTIEIYEIPAGKTEYEVASDSGSVPVAKTGASMKFDFTFAAASLGRRYSRYAIFLRSKEGNLTLGTEAQFAEVAYTRRELAQNQTYKGISTSNAAVASDIDADTVIIPVYLDMLFTESSSGYIYRAANKQYFFDKAYIDSLDGNVNSASASGAKVYLRFLLGTGDQFGVLNTENAEYILPNIYDEQTLIKIHSITDFLVGRYDIAGLSGIILGKGWENRAYYNYSEDSTMLQYIEKAAIYAATVSNGARSINSAMDIVLPFTSNGLFLSEDAPIGSAPRAKSVIEKLLQYFADTTEKGMYFSLMIEGDDVPFGITNDNISNGVDMKAECKSNCFCSQCQNSFATYLAELKRQYLSAPESYMYLWSIPSALSGNALSAAYAYSYYALLGADRLSSFVVSFSDTERNEQKLDELENILKYIDTSESAAVTRSVLAAFGVNSWRDIFGVINAKTKLIYNISPAFKTPSGCVGHFSYFDFSSHILDTGWRRGVGCRDIRAEYADADERALRAELSGETRADLIYKHEKYENLKYAPYLEFDIMLVDESKGGRYALAVSFGNENVRFESSAVVFSGERTKLMLDLTAYEDYLTSEDLKISVRPLDSDSLNDTVLWLYDVEGHSRQYTSEQLEELIGRERENIDNDTFDKNDGQINNNIFIAITIILFATILGVVAIMLVKRDKGEKHNDKNENT